MSEPSWRTRRLARELAEELRTLRVEDVLVNALLACRRSATAGSGATPDTEDDRDLEQARLAIETMKALTPVLETFVPPELIPNFAGRSSELQLAYVGHGRGSDPGHAGARTRPSPRPTSRSRSASARSSDFVNRMPRGETGPTQGISTRGQAGAPTL